MEPLGSSVGAVLRRASSAGITRYVVPAYDRASWRAASDLSERPGVRCALGIHPWAAAEGVDGQTLERALQSSGAVAVGEVGLDGKVDVPMDLQRKVLADQLEVALDLDLPVILHCRGDYDLLLSMLGCFEGSLRGVFHAFSRGPQLARSLVDLGLHLGVGGAATRPRARRIGRSLPGIPRERLLLETDSPSMGMDGVAPGESEPRDVRKVCVAAARTLEMEPGELAEITWRNADELFGLA